MVSGMVVGEPVMVISARMKVRKLSDAREQGVCIFISKYMKRYLVFSLLIIFSLTSSCKKYSKNKIFQIKHIKNIACNNIPINVSQIQNLSDTNLHGSYFSYLNTMNNTIGIYFTEKNHKINIPIPLKYTKKKLNNSDFFVYSLDSIFYFDKDLMVVILFDTTGKINNYFSVKSKYKPNPIATSFFVFSEDLYYSWLSKSDMSTRQNRKQTFEVTQPICKVTLDSLMKPYLYSTFGIYPNNYKNGNDYYDYGPSIFIGLQKQIISSFNADNNIYIYKNSKLISKSLCKSNFINEFKYIKDENNSDLSYCQVFTGEEPRYAKLIIDPYKKQYYRVTKLRMNIGKMDVKNAKWTMIIMNDSFQVIGEVILPFSKYMPDIIIPSKKGVYVKNTPKSKKEFNGNLTLSLLLFVQ